MNLWGIFVYIKMAVLFLSTMLVSPSANALELAPVNVTHARAPAGIDILGIKIGDHALDAEELLLKRGYTTKRESATSQNFPCSDGVCVRYQGYAQYAWILHFEKDQERVSVYITPPYAGSAVIRVSRAINYRGRLLPSFENLFKDARPKFGRAVTFDKHEVACWDFRSGALIDPPELSRGKACASAPMHRNISDGFLYMSRDASDQTVTYSMIDKIAEQQIDKYVAAALSSEVKKRRDKRQHDMNNAKTPDL